jgi:hypothetical protein
MKPKNDVSGEVVSIAEIHMTRMTFNIVGTSPLVPHAVSAKAKGSLLSLLMPPIGLRMKLKS